MLLLVSTPSIRRKKKTSRRGERKELVMSWIGSNIRSCIIDTKESAAIKSIAKDRFKFQSLLPPPQFKVSKVKRKCAVCKFIELSHAVKFVNACRRRDFTEKLFSVYSHTSDPIRNRIEKRTSLAIFIKEKRVHFINSQGEIEGEEQRRRNRNATQSQSLNVYWFWIGKMCGALMAACTLCCGTSVSGTHGTFETSECCFCCTLCK